MRCFRRFPLVSKLSPQSEHTKHIIPALCNALVGCVRFRTRASASIESRHVSVARGFGSVCENATCTERVRWETIEWRELFEKL